MDKIPSFTIDHDRLLRGIYVSRQDCVGNEVVTTFDIRMKEPNREPALHIGALHTIEHLAATYLRNDAEWKDRVVYWGPMGCLTGNYLILKGDLKSAEIVFLPISTHSTATPGIPPTSTSLKLNSFKRSPQVEPMVFTSDLPSRLRTLYTQ